MEVKEAIEKLERIIIVLGGMGIFQDYIKCLGETIELLRERGKHSNIYLKYYNMWKKLEYALTDENDYNVYSWSPKAREIMQDIEQKYFPKEEAKK